MPRRLRLRAELRWSMSTHLCALTSLVALARLHRLLHVCSSLVSILLLAIEVRFSCKIRLRLPFQNRTCDCVWGCWQALLTLVVGELLQTFIDFFPELVVHLLQVVDGDCQLRAGAAIIPLAGAYKNFHSLICIGHIVNSRQDIARA